MIFLEATIDLIFSNANSNQLGKSNNPGFDRLDRIFSPLIIGTSPHKQQNSSFFTFDKAKDELPSNLYMDQTPLIWCFVATNNVGIFPINASTCIFFFSLVVFFILICSLNFW